MIDLEAVVTDRDGQRVSGLEPKDFRLLVDGEEVPIEYFGEIRDGGVIQSAKEVPGLANTESAGTSFLLFIDDFFGLHNDKGRVMQAVAGRTDHMRPQDRVAVVAWDGRNLTLLSDWTDSALVVNDAIDASMARQSKGLQREAERRQWLDQRAVVANAPGRRARYFHGDAVENHLLGSEVRHPHLACRVELAAPLDGVH